MKNEDYDSLRTLLEGESFANTSDALIARAIDIFLRVKADGVEKDEVREEINQIIAERGFSLPRLLFISDIIGNVDAGIALRYVSSYQKAYEGSTTLSGFISAMRQKAIAQGDAQDKSDLLKQARGVLSEEKYDDALALFTEVVETSPYEEEVALALQNIGAIQYTKKDFATAAKTLEQALNMNILDSKNETVARKNYAFALASSADPKRAITEFQKLRVLDPVNEVDYVYYAGLSALSGGSHDEAEVLLSEVIALDATYRQAYFSLASLYLQLDALNKSVNILQQYLEIDPKNAKAHRNLSKIYLNLGNQQLAEDYAKLADLYESQQQ